MDKILIKSFFTDWHEVSKEQAKEYVKFLLKSITTMEGQKLEDYINKNRIKGTNVKELLGGNL